MRYITVPEDIVVHVKDQTTTITFKACLEMWLDDPRFGKSQQTLRFCCRIDRQAAGTQPGDIVELEDADWALLADVVRDPGVGYNPAAMRRAIPMLDAVTEAPDAKPPTAQLAPLERPKLVASS